LTATPVQNSLSELFFLTRMVSPETFPNYEEWKDFVMDERGRLVRGSRLGELRERIAPIMCRTRRSETGLSFPEREVSSYSLEPSPQESSLIAKTYELVRSLRPTSNERGFSQLARISLLQSLSSHPIALLESLHKTAISDGVGLLGEITSLAESVKSSVKESALYSYLENAPDEQAVLFVERIATGNHVTKALTDRFGPAKFYHGGLDTTRRKVILESFKNGSLRYFVSTSAGSEGLNLQNASVLVNFDLHWNPLRLEQRIGRVHRMGQKKTVKVLNLSTKGTIDDLIQSVLWNKIGLFKMAVGEIDTILTEFSDDFDFESEIDRIVASSRSDDDIKTGLEKLSTDLQSRIGVLNESLSLTRSVLDG